MEKTDLDWTRASGSASEEGSPQPTPDISKEGTESFSLSSDSESESINSSNENYGFGQYQETSVVPNDSLSREENIWPSEELSTNFIKKKEYGSYNKLAARTVSYEEELKLLNQKLQQSEKEKSGLRSALEKSDMVAGNLWVQLEAAKSDIKYRDAEIEVLNSRALQLEKQVVELQNQISDSSHMTGILTEELKLARDHVEKANEDRVTLMAKFDSERRHVVELQEMVSVLKAAQSEAEEKFNAKKEQLLSEVADYLERQKSLEAGLKEWECRCKSMEESLSLHIKEKIAMTELHDAEKSNMDGSINLLKEALARKDNEVERLNKDLDKLKLKYDMLMAEKDGLNAHIQTMSAAMSTRDDQIHQMEQRICRLQKEHEELIARSSGTQKLVGELRMRVEELEKEVDIQKVLILDGAEKKREAIRQLCFSLEHYRSGYQELRQAFLGHKRHAVLAS